MFLSRKTELERMKTFLSSDGTASLVYGRRRVGKTSLVKEASKSFNGKIISYLCTKESYEVNLDDLTGEYCLAFNDSNRTFTSFPDFFRFLRSLDEDILVILDEYSNLKEGYGGIETDSMMQKIIDSLSGYKVKIVLLGSEVTVMKELLDGDNPLFDRFDLTIHLEPFDYFDSALFFPDTDLRWKVDTLAVFGGLPAVLEQVDPCIPLTDNIKRLFIEGGAGFMATIIACLVFGLAVAIERIIYLNLASTNTEKLLKKVEEALNNGGVEAAKDVCRNTRGPVASIFYQGLLRYDKGVEEVEKSITSYGSVQMGQLEGGLSWITLFIAVAPMLGFMGTVIGMIQAFDEIQRAGDISPTLVAGGMKVALITTVGGLIVAIILQILYNYLISKVDGIVLSMEDASISLVDMIVKYQNK